jgi:hypothetical protein
MKAKGAQQQNSKQGTPDNTVLDESTSSTAPSQLRLLTSGKPEDHIPSKRIEQLK